MIKTWQMDFARRRIADIIFHFKQSTISKGRNHGNTSWFFCIVINERYGVSPCFPRRYSFLELSDKEWT